MFHPQPTRESRRGLLMGALAGIVVMTAAAPPSVAAPPSDPSQSGGAWIHVDRQAYQDRLHAMWLGQSIANWTGLQTEFDRVEPPFYTDDDWANIGFVTDQDPWLADDDTDIEYVYLHTASQAGTPALTPLQIADAWQRHINEFIWVSNARARELMRHGATPPATGLGMANPDSLAIDAQLTTEFFGAFAPGMPAEALRVADIPIRTTAEGHAYHASQFFVLLYSLAPLVEDLSPQDQPEELARLARQYLPDDSKAADIVDFVVADFLANPDIDDWESTRDRIYRRYQLEAEENGFRYRSGVESSINFAAGVMALLYGDGDYKRTVQIGTMSGWDSDNATATLGGLIGLLRGTDYLHEQFPDVELSDRYHIYRTRDHLPDHLPADPDAEDTFAAMAERTIPLVERTVVDVGGAVTDGGWSVPSTTPPDPSDLDSLAAVSPGSELLRRSANHQVRRAGGTVEVSSSLPGDDIDGGSPDVAVVADGEESDFTGTERFERPRFFTAPGPGAAELTVTYGRPWTADTVRIITGPAGAGAGLHDVEVQLRTEPGGQWKTLPPQSFATAEVRGDLPHQIVDVHLGDARRLTGVRVVGDVADGDRLAVAEIDALAPAGTTTVPADGPLMVTPRSVVALPGTEVAVDVAVPNTGSRTWAGTVELVTPEDWQVRPASEELDALAPDATWTHTFTVHVPEDAERGTVNLRAEPHVGGVGLPSAAGRLIVMDEPVAGISARGLEGNATEVSWTNVDADARATYRIYGSTDPDFEIGADALQGETTALTFTHLGLDVDTTWYYRVVATDDSGNLGSPSDLVSATSGSIYQIEAEHLLPPVEATKPALHQENCCGLNWSGGAQIWFQSNAGKPGDFMTLEFAVPAEGTFKLVTGYTEAWDFGIHQLSIDGRPIGEPFDAYSPDFAITDVMYGPIHLTEGEHTLTLTVTGQNPSAGGLGLGIDKLELIPS